MVRINKGSQPKALKRVLKRGATIYKNLPQDVIDKLRDKLLADQGYVCCYCMKKIPERLLPQSKIEHFRSRHYYPDLQLSYSNLFIACNGVGNGSSDTCDTLKGKSNINSFTLTNTNFDDVIRYGKDGSILSTDPDIDTDLNNVLGLNEENLRAKRYNIYLAMLNIKKRFESKGNYQLQINREIEKWRCRDSYGKFKEFYSVAIYYLS